MGTRGFEAGFLVALFLMPLSAALGSFVTLAGLAPARPVAVVLCVFALLRLRRAPSPQAVLTTVLAAAWLGWGFCLPATPAGVSELSSIGLGMATVAALVAEPAGVRTWRVFAAGWGLAWVVACVPALAEIATGEHLPNYLQGSPEYVRQASTDIASFFVNPNLFAYFITLASLVLVGLAGLARTGWGRIAMIAPMVLNVPLVYASGSRISTLIGLSLCAWTAWAWLPRLRRQFVALAAVGVAAGGLVALYSQRLRQFLETQSGGSTEGRLGLYRSGLHLWEDSLGLGVGAGRFEQAIARGAVPYDTGGALNPHSGVFELLTQYGLVPAAVAVACLTVVVARALPSFGPSASSQAEAAAGQFVVVSVLAMLVLSFANSTFLDSPIAWLHIASTIMASVALRCGTFAPDDDARRAPGPLGRRPRLRAYAESLAAPRS